MERFLLQRKTTSTAKPIFRVALLAFALAVTLAAQTQAPVSAEPARLPETDVAEPTMVSLLGFDFDPPQWGMPEATTWTHLDFSVISLEPGKTFDTNQGWYTSTDGPLLLSLIDGELTVTPTGPSLLQRSNARDQPLEENAAKNEVLLEPGDGIIFSIHDAATASNLGVERMHALLGLAGSEDFTVPGAFDYPLDVWRSLFEYDDGMPPPDTAGAHVSLQQLELRPYDTYAFEAVEQARLIAFAPNPEGVFWHAGVLDYVPSSDGLIQVATTTVYRSLGSGDFTMVNIGSEAVTFYFFVVEPGG